MVVKIRSLLTSGPIVVPLSTGTTVRLSPGQVSRELPDVEVADNAKVDKLRRRGMIEIETTSEPGRPTAAPTDTEAEGAGESEVGDGGSESRTRARRRRDPSG